MSEPSYDCPSAIVAAVIEPSKGEYYIMLGPGDSSATRWRMTESLLKKLRREINEKLD